MKFKTFETRYLTQASYSTILGPNFPMVESNVPAETLNVALFPSPSEAARLMFEMFGEPASQAILPEPIQRLLLNQHLVAETGVNSRFVAQYLAFGPKGNSSMKYVWADKSIAGYTAAPLLNVEVPPIRPANFGGAPYVITMTNISYGYMDGPKSNLVFAPGRRGEGKLYHYGKNQDSLDTYRNSYPFDSAEDWRGNVDLTDWFKDNVRPRLSLWDRDPEASYRYRLLAEFSTRPAQDPYSFRQLLEVMSNFGSPPVNLSK